MADLQFIVWAACAAAGAAIWHAKGGEWYVGMCGGLLLGVIGLIVLAFAYPIAGSTWGMTFSKKKAEAGGIAANPAWERVATYGGARYLLGYAGPTWVIWDRSTGGVVRSYPRDDAGWNRAWTDATTWEGGTLFPVTATQPTHMPPAPPAPPA